MTQRQLTALALSGVFLLACALVLAAQEPQIVGADELAKIVPAAFYYDGLSAPTQMRNASAVRFPPKRHVIAALVDTSGYASSVREKQLRLDASALLTPCGLAMRRFDE